MAGRGDVEPSGFGESLKRLRTEKGFTQKQVAEAAGLYPNSLAKLERGEHEPSWPLVLKLAKALGVDCTAFGRDDAQPPAGGPVAPLPPGQTRAAAGKPKRAGRKA